jgi:hypothetical protein
MTKARMNELMQAPYFLHPDPVAAEEVLREMRSETDNLGRMASFLFVIEAHPERAEEWKERYKFYFERISRSVSEHSLNSVGWNDYHMCRWLILGDQESLIELTERYTWGGEVGRLCRWMVNSVALQCEEFGRRFTAIRPLENQPREVA